MTSLKEAASQLAELPGVHLDRDAPLSRYTRFAIGGPVALLADISDEKSFAAAWRLLHCNSGTPVAVIGGGSNLVVADAGYPGVILRFTADTIEADGNCVRSAAGAELQDLVDFTIARGLAGIHTMTGVPGWVGGAIYGNAGAYGRSMHQNVTSVRFFDGREIRQIPNGACGFRYRHSRFKENKCCVVFSTEVELTPADAADLERQASEILAIRNAKYPPTMRCAGSIFKNLLYDELPDEVRGQVDPKVIREGKIPSAWFLEQVGAKGIRNGDIEVATYHANLIYNTGHGTAAQVREVIDDLKERVHSRFGFELEEEVQYIGF